MQTARGASLSTEQEPAGGTEASTEQKAGPGPRRLAVFAALAALVLAADYATKEVALARFDPQDPVEVLGGLVYLTLTFNSGAAFSIGQGFPWLFTIISLVVATALLVVAPRLRSPGWAAALGLILGGALGNLTDRIFREPALFQGHVVDWIRLGTFPVVDYDFPVFNIADSGIVCGGILAVVMAFRGVNLDGSRDTGAARSAGRRAGTDAVDE